MRVVVRRRLALVACSLLLVGWTPVDSDPPVADTDGDRAAQIIGGTPAPLNWGSVVARIVTAGGSLCSGTFISASWVLTAGHCIEDRATVYAGSTSVASLVSMGGAAGVAHPYFSITSLSIRYDFGLYRLDAPAPIDPLLVPSLASYDDTWAWQTGGSVTVLGWGRTSAGGSVSSNLLSADLNVVSDVDCATLDLALGNIYDPSTAVCARSPIASACNGDSGGPVVALGADNKYRIVGVTSYGPIDCVGQSVAAWVPAGLAWVRSVSGLELGGTTAITGGLVVTRIFGADRFETAAAVTADWRATDEVFIATGTKFPDALAAGAAAARFDAPVLLVDATGVPESTRLELLRLKPSKVYIAGGTSAVAELVVQQLRAIGSYEIIRIGGADRYETANKFTQTAWVAQTNPTVWVASGRDFADPLIAAAAAAVYDRPFVLIDGINPLPAYTKQLIQVLAPTSIKLLGADSSFSAGVLRELGSLAAVTRINAVDVSDRSAAVWDDMPISKWASVATANNFPDALAAVPFSAIEPVSPLMLIPPTCVPSSVRDRIARLGVDNLAIFGGPAAVSERVESLGAC